MMKIHFSIQKHTSVDGEKRDPSFPYKTFPYIIARTWWDSKEHIEFCCDQMHRAYDDESSPFDIVHNTEHLSKDSKELLFTNENIPIAGLTITSKDQGWEEKLYEHYIIQYCPFCSSKIKYVIDKTEQFEHVIKKKSHTQSYYVSEVINKEIK